MRFVASSDNAENNLNYTFSFERTDKSNTSIESVKGLLVERVNSFKFLGVHNTEDLTWSAHTDAVLKKSHQRLFFLRRLRKFGMSPRILRSFYTCTVESILTGCITAWFGNSTAGNRKALQRVVRTARHIVGGELPSLQDIYTRRCIRKARRITNDSSHPSHRLFSLLPSGRRLRSIRSRTSRLRDSFFPSGYQANEQPELIHLTAAVFNSSPRAPPLCTFCMFLSSLQTFVLFDRKCPAKWTSQDIPPSFQFEASVYVPFKGQLKCARREFKLDLFTEVYFVTLH